MMIAAEDEETLQNGTVVVWYKVGEQEGIRPNRHLLFKGAYGQQAIPVRVSGFHICFGKQSLPFVRLFKFAMDYQASH
jgi:hypothetical protein